MPEQTRTTGQALTQMKVRRYTEPSPGRRSVRRPEDIQRDVRGLKLRQRVTAVLNDDFIRHELEDTLGKHGEVFEEAESVRAYQDFLVPSNNFYGAMPGVSAVHPINDIRGTDTLNYTKSERSLRCKLAAAYRLVERFGWSINIYGHLTVRCPAEHGRNNFLINPFGLLYDEITASSLVKIDSDGNIVDNGSTNLGISRPGFVIHSAIHMARKDAKCVIHVHEPNAGAVACSKQGLLPISQEALMCGPISYHDYEGVSCDEGERERLANDFPEGSKILILRNHGVVCVGETVEEAMFYTNLLVMACTFQVKAMSIGLDNLKYLDEDMQKKVYQTLVSGQIDAKDSNLVVGMKQFEAWMRMLDSLGFRTGYVYHNPDLYNKTVQQPKSEARSPATMSSLRYEMVYGDKKDTPSRRVHSRGKGNTYKNRLKWLNSPVKATEYKKEIIHVEHSEPTILKDSQPEKETVVKILKESKSPSKKENIIQENIISTKPEIVMSEIPLESILNDDDSAFVEKGSNDAETKEVKPKDTTTTTEITMIQLTPADDGLTGKEVVMTSRTVVKGDGAAITTVEETVVGGEEQAESSNKNLLSPPGDDEEKADEGSDDGGEKGKDEDKQEGEGEKGVEGSGKPRKKVKKKRSFKETFQGMIHRRSKSDKEEDEEKS